MAQVSYGTITITDIPSSGSTNQHFWFNPTQQGTLLAGAYVTDTDIDTFKVNKSGGYVLIKSNGVEFGKGNYKSIELIAGTQNDSLNFYEPNSNIIDASLTSGGLVLSKGGIEAGIKDSSDYIYINSNDDATNHTLSINNSENKSDWRIVAGDKFGVDKAGNLYTSGAYITDISASNISAGTLSADRIGAGTITADKLDATDINASNSLSIGALSSDAQNSVLNSKIYENAGYRYKKDIVIYGESNKYYPVYFNNNQDEYNQNIPHKILITRAYSEQAPDDWNNSTYKGGLTLSIKWNYGGWGGATYKAEILDFNEMYSTMVGDVIVGTGSGMLATVYLRGGGTTGALYHISSDIKIDSERYGSTFPLIGITAGATIMQTGSYSWTVVSALTTPNTIHINSLIAENTAGSYITYINATDGIKVHNSNDSSNYLQLNSTAISLYKGGTERMKLDANNLRLGDSTNYANVNSNGLQVYKGTQVASFGNTSQIGPDNNYHIIINGNGMQFLPAAGGYGGASFTSIQQGMNINVLGENKPTLPTSSSILRIQNWIMRMYCEDNISSGRHSASIENTSFSTNMEINIGVGQTYNDSGGTSASIRLSHSKTKALNAFDKGELTIGQYKSYGFQVKVLTDINIQSYNSPKDDGSGIYGSSYLYFSDYKRAKSTQTSYGSAGVYYDSNRVSNGLSGYFLGLSSSGSSKRYKHDINLLIDSSIDPHNLYKVEVVQFFYNDDYVDKNDLRYGIPLPGFIAEDLYKAYPVAIDFNEKGEIETWNERYIIPPMLKLIQEQHQEIEQLKKDIIDLKRRVK